MSACLNDLFSLWTFLDAIDGLQEGYIETTFLPIRVSQKGCVKWQDKEPVGCMSKEPRSRSDNCEQTSGRMSFCRNVQQIWESLFFLLKTAVWYFPVATFGAAYPSWMSNFFMLAKLLCVLNMTWHPKVVLGCKSFHKVVPYSSAASVSLSIFVPYFTVCFALAHVFTAFCPTGRKQEKKNTTGLRYFLFSSCMWNPPPPQFYWLNCSDSDDLKVSIRSRHVQKWKNMSIGIILVYILPVGKTPQQEYWVLLSSCCRTLPKPSNGSFSLLSLNGIFVHISMATACGIISSPRSETDQKCIWLNTDNFYAIYMQLINRELFVASTCWPFVLGLAGRKGWIMDIVWWKQPCAALHRVRHENLSLRGHCLPREILHLFGSFCEQGKGNWYWLEVWHCCFCDTHIFMKQGSVATASRSNPITQISIKR